MYAAAALPVAGALLAAAVGEDGLSMKACVGQLWRLLPDLRAGCPPAVSSVSIREIIASFICIGIVVTSIAMKIVMCCVEVV